MHTPANTSAKTPDAAARSALRLVLGASIVAWLFFVGAQLGDVLVSVGYTNDELWGPDAVVVVYPSVYLMCAAIAALTLGGLFGKRMATRALLASPGSPLPRSVRMFASTVIIIGLAFAAGAAVALFLDNFLASPDNHTTLQRILSAYLPIVLYTAIVVAVILVGFVFTPSVPRAALASNNTQTVVDPSPEVRRATAFAFSLPILAAMVALVFGLIIYDATQTSLDAWIWVIVQLIIGVGIVAGTVFAARAMRLQLRGHRREQVRLGASLGSARLNLVLSIVFAVVVGAMAMSYGSSAVNQLRVQASLTASAYVTATDDGQGEAVPEPGAGTDPAPDVGADTDTDADADIIRINVYGNDLARGSDVTITFEPSGEVFETERVGRDGGVWIDATVSKSAFEDNKEIVASAQTADRRPITATVPEAHFGRAQDPGAPFDYSAEQPSRLMTPGAGWLLQDFAPALVLLLLAVGTLYFTLTVRGREPERP